MCIRDRSKNLRGVISGGVETKLIAVGVGDTTRISDKELNSIASDPDNENAMRARYFFNLPGISDHVLREICEGW